MAIDYRQIGQRLRAYRLGAGLTPEAVADQLGISRAGLYKYEKGGVIKLETIEKLAELLDVSVPSLLGVGTEYFANSVAYFERLRQSEHEADQVIAYFEPVSYLLMSPDYPGYLRQMLIEGLPDNLPDWDQALLQIERVIKILDERRVDARARTPNIISIVGATQVERFLHAGLIGTYRLSEKLRAQRRAAARREIERVATLMDDQPIGVQIGVVEDTLPNQTFQIMRGKDATLVAVSPFRLGELPNIRLGVGSVTAAEEAVTLYQKVANDLWTRAYKGAKGAAFLRDLIAASEAAES